MDANLTTLIGGGAIFATIAMAWDKFKFVFVRISSLLVVNVKIDSNLQQALNFYANKQFKRFKYQPLSYSALDLFIKPVKRMCRVGYEDYMDSKTLYFQGWKPFVLSFGIEKSTQNGERNKLSASFIRGTFNIEKMVIEALDLYNENKTQRRDQSRYFIRHYTGTNWSNGKQENDSPSIAQPSNEREMATKSAYDKYEIINRGCKFLKWNPDEIGEEVNNQKIKYLAFPKEVHEFLVEIKQWKESEDWYKEKKIPWKRGYIFYGKPGTGKSALISAIAQLYDLPVCIFDLSSMSNRDFKRNWKEALSNAPCIVLMEDIDNVFKGRDNITKSDFKDSLTFDCFLNTISGIENSDGILLMLTTNKIEELDEALGKPRTDKHINGTFISTRPGRIDRVLELKVLDEECRNMLAQRILSDCPDFIEKTVKDGEGDTGAQFQERCSQVALREYWKGKR